MTVFIALKGTHVWFLFGSFFRVFIVKVQIDRMSVRISLPLEASDLFLSFRLEKTDVVWQS